MQLHISLRTELHMGGFGRLRAVAALPCFFGVRPRKGVDNVCNLELARVCACPSSAWVLVCVSVCCRRRACVVVVLLLRLVLRVGVVGVVFFFLRAITERRATTFSRPTPQVHLTSPKPD